RMYNVFRDNESRMEKESRKQRKRVEAETRQKLREESIWEKSIAKEEARGRGVMIREKAAEKRRFRDERTCSRGKDSSEQYRKRRSKTSWCNDS
ncbi:Hypothetical predicted protein, partial [Paramuricea clavata]